MQKNLELTFKKEPPSRPRDFGCQIEISKVYYRIQHVATSKMNVSHNQRRGGGEEAASTVFNLFVTFKLQSKASLKK